MRYGTVNVLIGGTRPFPWYYMHSRECLSGDLAEKWQARKIVATTFLFLFAFLYAS
jgi:hypothetical protein